MECRRSASRIKDPQPTETKKEIWWRRRQSLQACAEYIVADGRVAIAEAELLRATADALGCPMPPLLPEGP